MCVIEREKDSECEKEREKNQVNVLFSFVFFFFRSVYVSKPGNLFVDMLSKHCKFTGTNIVVMPCILMYLF